MCVVDMDGHKQFQQLGTKYSNIYEPIGAIVIQTTTSLWVNEATLVDNHSRVYGKHKLDSMHLKRRRRRWRRKRKRRREGGGHKFGWVGKEG